MGSFNRPLGGNKDRPLLPLSTWDDYVTDIFLKIEDFHHRQATIYALLEIKHQIGNVAGVSSEAVQIGLRTDAFTGVGDGHGVYLPA